MKDFTHGCLDDQPDSFHPNFGPVQFGHPWSQRLNIFMKTKKASWIDKRKRRKGQSTYLQRNNWFSEVGFTVMHPIFLIGFHSHVNSLCVDDEEGNRYCTFKAIFDRYVKISDKGRGSMKFANGTSWKLQQIIFLIRSRVFVFLMKIFCIINRIKYLEFLGLSFTVKFQLKIQ